MTDPRTAWDIIGQFALVGCVLALVFLFLAAVVDILFEGRGIFRRHDRKRGGGRMRY